MLLEVKNMDYFYQDGDEKRYILKDVSCEFQKGVFYTILGASGSGKTTFLSLISALDTANAGEILYEGESIQAIGAQNYRRNKIGIIFQAYNLISYMSAVENVLVAMDITDNELPMDNKAVAYNLLDFIGINREKAERPVNQLSGGEQQRVAIARSLSTGVELLLADEPTGNLNEEMEDKLIEIFQNLAHKEGKCVIVVTHSNKIAESSDAVYRLSKGVLLEDE